MFATKTNLTNKFKYTAAEAILTWGRLTASSIVLVIVAVSGVEAQPLTILEDAGTTVEVTDLTGFATTGDEMVGMEVTVFSSFLPGGSETVSWMATGADAGGATGNGWSLVESGDTFGDSNDATIGRWQFDVIEPNMLVDSILLSGVAGDGTQNEGVVFDRTVEPFFFGTDGSARGRDFEYGPTAFTGNTGVELTYRNLIDSQADGAGAVGDIFGEVEIDFVLPAGGGDIGGQFGANDRLLFYMDTDLVGVRDDDDCPPGALECVPEPTSFALGILPLAALALRARQRARLR